MAMKKATVSHGKDVTFIGGFEITKIVREHVPIVEGDGGSFGDMLNAQLEEAAMNGQEVQSIKFDIEPEAWVRFATEVCRLKRDEPEIAYRN